MPRLLKPITITDRKFLMRIFIQCLSDWDGLRIIDKELGSPQRGTVDLLAVDKKKKPHLITIGPVNIEEGLVRCLTGYRWFKENQSILKRIFSPEEMDFDLPVKLLLFTEQVIPEASKLTQEISRVPISLYRYTCFGSKDDPMIYVESLDSQPTFPDEGQEAETEPQIDSKGINIEEIKKKLRIELADLNTKEIEEFLNFDLP
ncbi:MAG: hypothetical protein ACMUIU_18585 [bacterium]